MLCDECNIARALVVVSLPSGRTLAYCRHHSEQHFEALTELGALIIPTNT